MLIVKSRQKQQQEYRLDDESPDIKKHHTLIWRIEINNRKKGYKQQYKKEGIQKAGKFYQIHLFEDHI